MPADLARSRMVEEIEAVLRKHSHPLDGGWSRIGSLPMVAAEIADRLVSGAEGVGAPASGMGSCLTAEPKVSAPDGASIPRAGEVLTNAAGEVAVLYSPGYGAGWWTWASKKDPAMVLDRELAEAVLNRDGATMLEVAQRKWPDEYHGGVADLQIEWMRPGSAFRIDEYDGSERIVDSYEDWIAVPAPGIAARSAETEGFGPQGKSPIANGEAPVRSSQPYPRGGDDA